MRVPRPTQTAVLEELAELFTQTHENVPAFLNAVLLKTSTLILSDLACVAVAEDFDDQQWVIVRDAANYIIGAEAGEWERFIGRLRVGGEELRHNERSFVGFVAHTAKSRRSGNVQAETHYRASNHEVMSELAAPILFQGHVLGVINLESKKKDFFTGADQNVLEFVAKLIAPSLHSLMIEEGLRRPIVDVLERLASGLDAVPVGIPLTASGVMAGIARTVSSALKSRFCQIFFLHGDYEVDLVGDASCYDPDHSQLSSHADALARKAIQEKCLVTEGLKYRAGSHGSLETKGSTSITSTSASSPPMMATPMFVFGNPVGAIVVGCRQIGSGDPRQTFTGSDIHLLNAIQGQLAAFVEVKRVEQSRREQSTERSRQASLISAIFVEPDLDTVLRKTVLRVPELCEARYCSVFLWKPDEKAFVLAASKGLPSDQIGVASYVPGEGLTGWVGKHGRSLILDSRALADLERVSPDLAWKSKYDESGSGPTLSRHPFAAVPIFQNGKTVGVLRVSGCDQGSFTEGDEFLLTLVAAKIATAIEYGEKYKERIRLLRGLEVLMMHPRDVQEGDHSETFLRQAGREALRAFKADNVLIYRVVREGFETPPVWEGELRDKKVMASTRNLAAKFLHRRYGVCDADRAGKPGR